MIYEVKVLVTVGAIDRWASYYFSDPALAWASANLTWHKCPEVTLLRLAENSVEFNVYEPGRLVGTCREWRESLPLIETRPTHF